MLRKNAWMIALAALLAPSTALADDVTAGQFTANNVWMMVCAGLVFIMHLGFATLESGLTQAKNTVNILFKNTFIVCIGLVTYYVVGFNLMYPGDFNGFLGLVREIGGVEVFIEYPLRDPKAQFLVE